MGNLPGPQRSPATGWFAVPVALFVVGLALALTGFLLPRSVTMSSYSSGDQVTATDQGFSVYSRNKGDRTSGTCFISGNGAQDKTLARPDSTSEVGSHNTSYYEVARTGDGLAAGPYTLKCADSSGEMSGLFVGPRADHAGGGPLAAARFIGPMLAILGLLGAALVWLLRQRPSAEAASAFHPGYGGYSSPPGYGGSGYQSQPGYGGSGYQSQPGYGQSGEQNEQWRQGYDRARAASPDASQGYANRNAPQPYDYGQQSHDWDADATRRHDYGQQGHDWDADTAPQYVNRNAPQQYDYGQQGHDWDAGTAPQYVNRNAPQQYDYGQQGHDWDADATRQYDHGQQSPAPEGQQLSDSGRGQHQDWPKSRSWSPPPAAGGAEQAASDNTDNTDDTGASTTDDGSGEGGRPLPPPAHD